MHVHVVVGRCRTSISKGKFGLGHKHGAVEISDEGRGGGEGVEEVKEGWTGRTGLTLVDVG